MKFLFDKASAGKLFISGDGHLCKGVRVTSRPNFSKGMTLVELLAVAVILSIVIGGFLLHQSQSWLESKKDDKQLAAGHIAQQVLEQWLLVNDYQRVKDKLNENPRRNVNNDNELKNIWQTYQNITQYQNYRPTIELAYANETRQEGPIRVSVTVETEGPSQHKRSVTFHGIKSDLQLKE